MSYSTLLKDPRWQKKRLEVFERDNWTCCCCGKKTETLNVHHWKYSKKPWEIDDYYLSTLCEKCHLHVKGAMEYINNTIINYLLNSDESDTFFEKIRKSTIFIQSLMVMDGPYMSEVKELKLTMDRLLNNIESRSYSQGHEDCSKKMKNI